MKRQTQGLVASVPALRLLMTAAAIVGAVPASGLAQQPAPTFQELQRSIQLSERLVVTESSGAEVKGQLEAVSDSLIALQTTNGRREYRPHQVREIRRQPDSRLDGTLWGTLIGIGAGLSVGLALDATRGEGAWLAPSLTLAGAGLGAFAGWIGDTARPHADVLFRPGQGPAATLLPQLSRRSIGLRASLQF